MSEYPICARCGAAITPEQGGMDYTKAVPSHVRIDVCVTRMRNQRDAAIARAEAAEADLQELRGDVLLGLGMAAGDVAAIDDDLIDSTISYLLGGHKELAAEVTALRARIAELEAGQGWRSDVLPQNGQQCQIVLDAEYYYVSPAYSGFAVLVEQGHYIYLRSEVVEWRPAPPQE